MGRLKKQMKRYSAWQAKKLVDELRHPKELNAELDKTNALLATQTKDLSTLEDSLKCQNGHIAKWTTTYPATYPRHCEHVICDVCSKDVICKDGYYRCADDGSRCKNDWC